MKIPGYSIQRQIGQGGMAMVYYAIQESLGRPVALKVMNPLLADRPEFSQRFLNEGRLLAALRHNHIITIYDIGVSEQYHYISMEYVDGGDLKQRLQHGLAPLLALDHVITLGHCLKAAHDLHIVHRDIKPVNILFRRDGTLLLTDFGVAKNLATITELTTTGSMVGSPYYISPEQALGRALDGRADIYSLGIVFYEMLVGQKPFLGDSAIEIAMQHVNNAPPFLPQELSHCQPLLDKMIAKEPQDRFPHALSLLEAAQEVRDSMAQDDAGMTTSSRTLCPLASPHTTRTESSTSMPDAPDEPPLVAGTVLEEALILQEPEEASATGEAGSPEAPGTAVRRLTSTKIWLLAGVTGVLALAVMMATGSVIGSKHTTVPTSIFPNPPGLATPATGVAESEQPVDVAPSATPIVQEQVEALLSTAPADLADESLRKDETPHGQAPHTPERPSQQIAQSRARNATFARRGVAPTRISARSAQGTYSGVQAVSKASPGRQQFPPDQKSSMNE